MKILHLLRHAKSDWGDPALDDHARPLNLRGQKAAKAIGLQLAAEEFEVDATFCSTARRAQETYASLRISPRRSTVAFHDELYMVSPQDLLAFVRRAPKTARSILIIGHNPTTQDAAVMLSGRAAPGQRRALADLRKKYPTCALCTIRFKVSQWRQVAPGAGTLIRFLRPRDLKTAKRSPRR